jgi:DNA (cytosine-5)-methyltransferase 1
MKKDTRKVASLFSGAGGLDLGFSDAGFDVEWANEYDKAIWATYESNFGKTHLDRRSIVEVDPSEIPEVDGFIGGPPCQSWSEAGSARGISDHRGQLFFEYLRLVEEKKPLFFLAENVSGILFSKHNKAFESILEHFANLGYNVSYGLLNAADYGVPQDRHRVIIVGYQTHVGKLFVPPEVRERKVTLREAIGDLESSALPAANGTYANENLEIANHEYLEMGFSSMFMSRNRVRSWDEQSFTIQAGGRHAPLHPKAPKMPAIGKDKRIFAPGFEPDYRRLTVREAARIQSFPDDHKFVYRNVSDGYKMIGNAVPVKFAESLAQRIFEDLKGFHRNTSNETSTGKIAHFDAVPDTDLS